MRPLWLEIENIGPFVRKTRVDLDRIEEGGLFLISGPTGSGKSFIFDTICYALYGRTPSRREGNLRSDYAGVGEESRIRFSFNVGDDTFLIERTLEYEDHKRGGGTTVRPESASLFKIVNDGQDPSDTSMHPLASKKKEVHDRSVEILGIGMEQFSRIMMIPQGEFRELLRAETKDREALLRKLFDSSIYQEIENELAARFGRQLDGIKARTERRETLIQGLISDLDLETGPGEGLTFREWADSLMIKLEKDLRESDEMEKKTSRRWEAARKKLNEAREVFGTHQDLIAAEKSKEDLISREADKAADYRRRLDLSEKCSRFRPEIRKLDDLEKEKNEIALKMKSLNRDLENLEEERTEIGKKEEARADSLEKEIIENEAFRKSLRGHLPIVKEIDDMISEIDGIEMKLDGEIKRLSDLENEKKLAERRSNSLRDEITGLAPREDMVSLSITIKNGRDLAGILARIETISRDISDRKSSISSIKEEVISDREELSDLRKRREKTMAYELAKELKDGEECPVCGSTDHPHPRGPIDEDVTADMIDAKERSLEAKESELSSLEEDLTRIKTKMEELAGRSKDIAADSKEFSGMNTDDLAGFLSILEKRSREEEGRSARRENLEKEMDQIAPGIERMSRNIESLSKLVNDLNIRKEGMRSRFEERTSRLSDLGLDTAGGQLASQLDRLIESVESLIEKNGTEIHRIRERTTKIQEDILKIGEKLDSSRERFDSIESTIWELNSTLLVQISSIDGLDSIEDLRESILDDDIADEMKSYAKRFENEVSRLSGTADSLRIKLEKSPMKIPDSEELDRLEMSERDVQNEWRSSHTSSTRLKDSLMRTSRQIGLIEKVNDEMREWEIELKVLGRLTKEVRGKSVPRISLERFFLAQRFEEVLISSNHRLKILSGGRFLLRRAADEDRGARSKGGLDINVYDNYTGQERPANTLSGGQMFLSSLALALGLADVVQSRSGGIRMDALFIDEGFGSLDEETLQTALKVLTELRKGRMVGVISHVPELKRQIKDVIEITPGREGSIIRSPVP